MFFGRTGWVCKPTIYQALVRAADSHMGGALALRSQFGQFRRPTLGKVKEPVVEHKARPNSTENEPRHKAQGVEPLFRAASGLGCPSLF